MIVVLPPGNADVGQMTALRPQKTVLDPCFLLDGYLT